MDIVRDVGGARVIDEGAVWNSFGRNDPENCFSHVNKLALLLFARSDPFTPRRVHLLEFPCS